MNETWEKKMAGTDRAPSCARAEDLVAYLYDEMESAAALDFSAHAQHCASCHAELAGFRQVRVSIGEWRQQALGSLASTAAATTSPAAIEPVRHVPERKRSALAALREFFTLSPAWMRAATVALGLIFCALIVLTVSRYSEQPKVVAVKSSEAQLVKIIDGQGTKKATDITPTPQSSESPPSVVETSGLKDGMRQSVKRSLRQAGTEQSKLAGVRKPKISPEESRGIARDLRLIASKEEEEDLPRLSDLLGESN